MLTRAGIENANRDNTYSLSSSATHYYSTTNDGNRIRGSYSLTDQTSDEGGLIKEGSDRSGGTFTLGETTAGNASLTRSGNTLTGEYSITESSNSFSISISQDGENSTGSYTLCMTDRGNYVDSKISFTETGSDRYDVFEQFNNTANNTAAGAAPGNADFSQVGAVIVCGLGVTPPTGGGSFSDGKVSTDAVFSELGSPIGSQAATHVHGPEQTALPGMATARSIGSDLGLALGSQAAGYVRGLEGMGLMDFVSGEVTSGTGDSL